MNNFKKILLSVIFVLSTILFSGCLTSNYNITIRPDGGSIMAELTMEKSTYDALEIQESDVTEDGGTISFYTEDDVEYVKFSQEQTYSTLAELEQAIATLGTESNEDAGASSSDYFTDFSLKLVDNKFVVSGTFNTIPDADTVYTKCTITLIFPGNITSHTIGTKKDDRTLSINMLNAWKEDATKTFSITAESGPNYIFIVIVGVAIAGLVGLAIFTIALVAVKNKQRAMASAPVETAPAMESDVTPVEEPEDYYVDAYGNTYYLDDSGNPYYLDDNGNPFYIDNNGNPFYVTEDGTPFYVDENGNPFYYDEEGNPHYFE